MRSEASIRKRFHKHGMTYTLNLFYEAANRLGYLPDQHKLLFGEVGRLHERSWPAEREAIEHDSF